MKTIDLTGRPVRKPSESHPDRMEGMAGAMCMRCKVAVFPEVAEIESQLLPFLSEHEGHDGDGIWLVSELQDGMIVSIGKTAKVH